VIHITIGENYENYYSNLREKIKTSFAIISGSSDSISMKALCHIASMSSTK